MTGVERQEAIVLMCAANTTAQEQRRVAKRACFYARVARAAGQDPAPLIRLAKAARWVAVRLGRARDALIAEVSRG
jgi:hypothetical protein